MKLSPFLQVDTPTSFRDHPGVHSILFYTDINLCNLNCFQCHNRYFFSKLGNTEFMNYEELSQKLSMAKLLGVELVIVSGGEPTLEPNLEEGLSFVKERGFPIRLDTNRTNPKNLKNL
jgi:pyruvate formate lyase activating enzyme